MFMIWISFILGNKGTCKKKKIYLMRITLIKKGNISGFILLPSLFLAWTLSALLSSLTGTSPARLRLVAHKALVSLWKCSWRWWLCRACSCGTAGRKIYGVPSRKIKHFRGVEEEKKTHANFVAEERNRDGSGRKQLAGCFANPLKPLRWDLQASLPPTSSLT